MGDRVVRSAAHTGLVSGCVATWTFGALTRGPRVHETRFLLPAATQGQRFVIFMEAPVLTQLRFVFRSCTVTWIVEPESGRH